jgi:putative ABC transport system permease protein
VAVLRAALRDLQWRWKRFVIAMVGVGLVFAMGLVMTGLSESFSLEVDRTLQAVDAEMWAVSADASGPFTSPVPVPDTAAGPDASPVMVFRQTISDTATLADIVVFGVEPSRLGSPHVTHGVDLRGSGQAVVDESLDVAGLGDTFSVGGAAFRVVGTVSGQRLYAGLPVVYIPLRDAQAVALGGQALATAFLFAAAPSSVPAGLKTMSNGDVKADLLRPLRDARSSIAFVRLLLWIVAATIIGSVLYLQAIERTGDFAVFKATGTSTLEIGIGLALQAVVLSLAAAVLAALLAMLLAPLFPLDVEIPTSAFLLLPVVTVVVGLLASLVALRKTATVQPALAFGG